MLKARHLTLLLTLVAIALLTLNPLAAQETVEPDLEGIKTYLLDNATELQEASADLAAAADEYYALAEEHEFNYADIAADYSEEASEIVAKAQAAWMAASPLYEQIEGVVAGVPVLAEYDVILDAGVSAEEDPEGAVPFDLTLPDGRVLEQPGNIFGLLEATLWGTRPEFSSEAWVDLDASGEQDFGENLPEANMLQGTAALLAQYTTELLEASEAWEPNVTDAFTALVVMIPTMSEYFGSWKESRFIAGDEATRTDFVVISRLSDIKDILSGLEVVRTSVSPLIQTVSADQDAEIATGLADLQAYVLDLYEQEVNGRVFTAEEADFYGTEAQNRATTITGQIAQVAALLDIVLPE